MIILKYNDLFSEKKILQKKNLMGNTRVPVIHVTSRRGQIPSPRYGFCVHVQFSLGSV